MRVNAACAHCLYDKQMHKSSDPGYLKEIQDIIDSRNESDTAPYLVYLFTQVFERRFGKSEPYGPLKRSYNDLVLALEDRVRDRIQASPDPLATALAFARIGNYIDFGAMNTIEEDTFLSLLDQAGLTARDRVAYQSFVNQCQDADNFLLIADNCGEIVLDKLFLEQLNARFPKLKLSVLVRGSETLNDVVPEDAVYVGIDHLAEIVSSGSSAAGTIYHMLSSEAKNTLDRADVILAKGQGNYESLCGQGRHVFYSLLCKCDLFTERFHVPKLTGIFVEEN